MPVDEKTRIVLLILAGERTVAEAARRAKVSAQSIAAWKRQLLEADRPPKKFSQLGLGVVSPKWELVVGRCVIGVADCAAL
ncbi:helix-turn-helix domain-containing protein [Pseudonocardia sp. N23]|uniref:helix-turn-helix domain-containing protein n=1 Tax=Pseudonocardia sp. N23 TaxID=1987376 RepID=UPI0011454DFE|nr:helix-turn-helix domain-containing protein [Pseudonocardia sp. N23]